MFRQQLDQSASLQHRQLAYDGSLYSRDDFAWISSNFSCCFLMMCDQQFYDPVAGSYLIDQFLRHGQHEFGDYDSVVLWQAYPRIGLDDRNQFDFYRDMPGGTTRLRRWSTNCTSMM